MGAKLYALKAAGYASRGVAVLLAAPALYFMARVQIGADLGDSFLGDILRVGIIGTAGSLLRIFVAAILCFGPVGLFWWIGGWLLEKGGS